ncbi:MAG: putative manganese-dependent inorganic diphosphatase [Thermodesulfobacteriota bacterium]
MEKAQTFVIGHKNPDTDSICSAMALAGLKRAEGMENVEAARAGDLNPQTSFILDYLGIEPPRYLPDVFLRARDVMSTDVVTVAEDTPIEKVMEVMRSQGIRFIPVLDPGGRPVGVVTVMDLARRHIVKMDVESAREVTTSTRNIAATLGAEAVVDHLSDKVATLSVFVGAMAEGSFVKTVSRKDPALCAVIVGDRMDIQSKSVEMGMGLLVVTGGFAVDGAVLEAARGRGVSVVVSPFDTATTALLVRLSTPASVISDPSFVTADPDDPLDELKGKLTRGTTGLLVLDDDGRLAGLVTKTSLLRPSRTNLVLVDHNELGQAVDGAEEANIVEVVDHHRIGNFTTSHAIPFTCEPVGSTSTLVADLYRRRGVEIKKETAGLLLGGVLSDTVLLRSPTTTEKDHDTALWLEQRSGIDHRAFGEKIFAATSSIKKRGVEAVVRGDHKVFEVKGKSFGIGQVETIGFDEFYAEKEGLLEELRKVGREKGLLLSGLLVTDIVMGTSLLLVVGEREVLAGLGYPRLDEHTLELKNVISRKKQVVPHLLSVFNELY